ncbi:hypothetical protein [Streptomyces sp. NPDC020141]|uniref:hypothetical protein n=1 Tax=Streptomyces sp. NPDC020141 TaxID=3365065 RepID=UPI00378F4708
MGELVDAWTSGIAPARDGTGCRSAGGNVWGHRADGGISAGPVADAPDSRTDATSPDASLTSTLAATAPFAGTVSEATAYHQSFTFDRLGNRATLSDHRPATPGSPGWT